MVDAATACIRATHRVRTAGAKVLAWTQMLTSFLTFSCGREDEGQLEDFGRKIEGRKKKRESDKRDSKGCSSEQTAPLGEKIRM